MPPEDQKQHNSSPGQPEAVTGVNHKITPQPPVQNQVPPPIAEVPAKSRRWLIPMLVLLVIVLAGSTGYAVLFHKSSNKPSSVSTSDSNNSAPQAHLLYSDYQSTSITVTNKANNQLYKVNYSPAPYANLLASTKKGGVLLALSDNSGTQNLKFLDAEGKDRTVNSSAVSVLKASSYTANSMVLFSNENTLVLTICTPEQASSLCQLESLNLTSGTTQTILKDTLPPAPPAGSTFNLIGLTDDSNQAYLEVGGPSDLGQDAAALYKVNLATKQAVKVLALPSEFNSNLTMSPNHKKLVYDSQEGGSDSTNPTIIHVIDIATGVDTKTNWINDYIAEGGSVFQWSPDSNKVLFQGNKFIPGNYLSGVVSSIGAITTAYLDLGKDTITNLQTIQDSAHKTVYYQSWIDNNTIAYSLNTTSNPYNFTNSTAEAFKQDISSKAITKLAGAPTGDLQSVIFWY